MLKKAFHIRFWYCCKILMSVALEGVRWLRILSFFLSCFSMYDFRHKILWYARYYLIFCPSYITWSKTLWTNNESNMSSAFFNLSRKNAFKTVSGFNVWGRLSSLFISVLVYKNKEFLSLDMQLSGLQHSNTEEKG